VFAAAPVRVVTGSQSVSVNCRRTATEYRVINRSSLADVYRDHTRFASLRSTLAVGSVLACVAALLLGSPVHAEPGDDDPDLQSLQITRTGSATPVAVERLSQHMVDLGDASTSVADLATRVFRDNASFLRQAEAAPNAAVFGRPSVQTTAMELPDSYVLTQTTTVVVDDPDALARSSAAFRAFRPEPGDTPSYSELPQEARDGIDRLWAQTTSMPEGHPLREAGELGRQELVEAVYQGAGQFEVEDTFTVAKAAPAGSDVNRHVVRNDGLVDYGVAAPPLQWQPLPLLQLPRLPAPAPAPAEAPVPAPAVTRGGRHEFTAKFLTGFTRGRSWDWQRRWNFPSGFFRLSLGASYGLGLRVPVQVTGSLSPTRIRRSAGVDSQDPIELTLNAQPLDADAAYYSATGLPQEKLFDGREFVLNAQVYYGLRLRALFMNIAYVPRTTFGVDLNQNWRPPFGDYHGTDEGTPTFTIPTSATHTEFNPLPGLSGWAQFGINVHGTGRTLITQQPVIDGERRSGRRLEFGNTSDRNRTFLLPALRPDVGDSERVQYGFRLSDPRYVADLSLIPMLRVGVTAGYRSFSRTFRTDWISMPSAEVRLGNLSLARHDGTTAEHVAQPGNKRFARTRGDAGTDRAVPAVLALRAPNDRYIRAGLTAQTYLGPSSRRMGGWERFEAHVARIGNWRTNPKFTLRSLQNGRYVRAGVSQQSRLAAVSERVSPDWEWFRRVELAGGRWALKSAHSNRYVVLGRHGYLQATGRDLDDAYRLRPISLDNNPR
jgi:hypothetical protein